MRTPLKFAEKNRFSLWKVESVRVPVAAATAAALLQLHLLQPRRESCSCSDFELELEAATEPGRSLEAVHFFLTHSTTTWPHVPSQPTFNYKAYHFQRRDSPWIYLKSPRKLAEWPRQDSCVKSLFNKQDWDKREFLWKEIWVNFPNVLVNLLTASTIVTAGCRKYWYCFCFCWTLQPHGLFSQLWMLKIVGWRKQKVFFSPAAELYSWFTAARQREEPLNIQDSVHTGIF